MKLQWQGKDHACTVEMEHGVADKIDSTFTIQFKLKHKHKVHVCPLSLSLFLSVGA
jgi:hypothetical protein